MPSLNKSVTGLNQLKMGSQPSLLDNWIFKGNAGIKKQCKRPQQISLTLKNTTFYHKNE
jgi:hypothetical protein